MFIRCSGCRRLVLKRKTWPTKYGGGYCVGCMTEINRLTIEDNKRIIQKMKDDLEKYEKIIERLSNLISKGEDIQEKAGIVLTEEAQGAYTSITHS